MQFLCPGYDGSAKPERMKVGISCNHARTHAVQMNEREVALLSISCRLRR
jgi:hypothetical protein